MYPYKAIAIEPFVYAQLISNYLQHLTGYILQILAPQITLLNIIIILGKAWEKQVQLMRRDNSVSTYQRVTHKG